MLNIMIYSAGRTVFLKSIDASNKIKDSAYLYGVLKEVVNDNGSAYVKAGK